MKRKTVLFIVDPWWVSSTEKRPIRYLNDKMFSYACVGFDITNIFFSVIDTPFHQMVEYHCTNHTILSECILAHNSVYPIELNRLRWYFYKIIERIGCHLFRIAQTIVRMNTGECVAKKGTCNIEKAIF